MTAFPMLTRCAWHQWRGLTATERADLARAWGRPWLKNACELHAGGILQISEPIWVADGVTVVSIKTDCVPSGT